MKRVRLDIGGPKGNAYYIMGTVKKLCGSAGEADRIISKMMGDTFKQLGGKGNDYEGLLAVYLEEFPFVELYATHDIGIDRKLYTLDEEPEIVDL